MPEIIKLGDIFYRQDKNGWRYLCVIIRCCPNIRGNNYYDIFILDCDVHRVRKSQQYNSCPIDKEHNYIFIGSKLNSNEEELKVGATS